MSLDFVRTAALSTHRCLAFPFVLAGLYFVKKYRITDSNMHN